MRSPPEDDLINPSLLEPVLIAGVDRRLLGLEFLFVVILLTLKGLGSTTILVSLLVVVPAHAAAVRMSRIDPRMFDMLAKHLAWQRYYPAHASHRAVHPRARRSRGGWR